MLTGGHQTRSQHAAWLISLHIWELFITKQQKTGNKVQSHTPKLGMECFVIFLVLFPYYSNICFHFFKTRPLLTLLSNGSNIRQFYLIIKLLNDCFCLGKWCIWKECSFYTYLRCNQKFLRLFLLHINRVLHIIVFQVTLLNRYHRMIETCFYAHLWIPDSWVATQWQNLQGSPLRLYNHWKFNLICNMYYCKF